MLNNGNLNFEMNTMGYCIKANRLSLSWLKFHQIPQSPSFIRNINSRVYTILGG